MTRVALLGYGRFGRALAGLLSEAGAQVRAFDPRAAVEGVQRAASPQDLAAGAEVVLLAVPVPQMHGALCALRPHLHPGQLVLDVGSVKVRPVTAMAEVLGTEVPWAGTHPLFGPVSLALAERPLRVVVCPNPLHPDAAPRARELYQSLGCEVIEEDAETHDRVMASTHAMAFYIAKGMLDAGMSDEVPFSPPSFQAMARLIATVRGDAGHLFTAIQHENPFSEQARRRLLDALGSIHEALLGMPETPPDLPPAPPAGPHAAALDIPDLGVRSPELREVRELIDGIDRDIVDLLARRAQLARRAARAKAGLGHAVRDPAREAALFASRRAWAQERDLDPTEIEEIFACIVRYSRRVQDQGPP